MDIELTIGTITLEEMTAFFIETDKSFYPPVSATIDPVVYAKKLHTLATTFEYRVEGRIVGLAAVYINEVHRKDAFVPFFCILPEYRGGFRPALKFRDTIAEAAKNAGFERLIFEICKENKPLIKMYEIGGFKYLKDKDEIFMYMYLDLKRDNRDE